MKTILLTFLAFCFIAQISAQPRERFYKGTSLKKMKQQGQNIDLEICDDDSQTTLNINAVEEVQSESKKYKGSCADMRDVQLTDKGVLKNRISQFGDTLVLSKYEDNGRLMFQKSIVKADINRFQPKLIAYEKGGYVVSFVNYPKEGSTFSTIGYIIFDANGIEIVRKTVDSLADPAPFSILLDGAQDADFYVLQGTNSDCGKYKLHKISRTIKAWTTPLTYSSSCDNFQLQSFAISNQKDRLGLLFIGTSTVTFSKYFMVNNTTGSIMPTTFDISTRVRYNTKTTFGRNNEVYFARVVDYNTINSPVPDRSALELLRFDVNQDVQSRKRYFDTKKNDTDTLPQLEDMLVTADGTIYVSGARLKRSWLFSDKDASFGLTSAQQQNVSSIYIRQVLQEVNNPNIVLEVESSDNKALKFDFYNALGQVVITETRTVSKGINNINLNFARQGKGLYIVKISNIEGAPSFKFTKM